MGNLAKERTNLQSTTIKIRDVIQGIAKDFLYIGFLLYEAQFFEYYLEGGYANVFEYAQAELGFKKSSVYNFIRVYDRFGGDIKHYGPNYQITHNWSKYSYSQLCEMLSLSDRQLEAVTPEMTVKDIRLLKQGGGEVSRRLENDDVPDLPDLKGYMLFDSSDLTDAEMANYLVRKVEKLFRKGFKIMVGFYK